MSSLTDLLNLGADFVNNRVGVAVTALIACDITYGVPFSYVYESAVNAIKKVFRRPSSSPTRDEQESHYQ